MKCLILFAACTIVAIGATFIGKLGFYEYFFYLSLGAACTDPVWSKRHTGSIWG